jgi:hypothetical protein
MKILCFIAFLAAASIGTAHACDCSLPKNYGNPQCAAQITAALKGVSSTSAVSNSSAASKSVSGSSAQATVGAITVSPSQQQGQKQSQSQTAEGGQGGNATATNAGNAQTIEQNYQAARIPVATAFAAALTAAPCGIGSTSAGVQTGPVGISFGSTRKDKKEADRCARFDALRVAFTISPLVGCYDAITVLPDIKSAMDAAGLTCEQIFNPPVVEKTVYVDVPGPTVYVNVPCQSPAPLKHRAKKPAVSCAK